MLFGQLLLSNKVKYHLEKWGVRISAILTLLMGVVNLISAVQPALRNRFMTLQTFIPLEVSHGSRITSALAGFALLLLASNLWRRKRVAWILTLFLLVISILTHLVKGLDFEEASLSLFILVFLILLRNSFHAESDRPSVKQGLYTLVAALAFTIVYGAIGFYLLDRHFNVQFGLGEAIRQTVVMFTSFYNPGLEPISGFGRYFAASIYMIGLGTLGFAIIMLIRPVLVRQPSTVEERNRAEKIVRPGNFV
jgi:phosphatidylglycerol lysyltransferase